MFENYSLTPYECAVMSNLAYSKTKEEAQKSTDELISRWEIIDELEVDSHSYRAIAFKLKDDSKEKIIVIAHRGSQSQIDLLDSDVSIGFGDLPEAHNSAHAFSQKIRLEAKNRGYFFVETGHSLGAFHAQINACRFDGYAITFDSPGTKISLDKFAGDQEIGTVVNVLNCQEAAEYHKQMAAWKLPTHQNKILFIFSPINVTWEAHLLRKNGTSDKVVIAPGSSYLELLSQQVVDEKKIDVLRTRLNQEPLFSHQDLILNPNAYDFKKIKSFLSAPNIVNTANEHIGDMFRVYIPYIKDLPSIDDLYNYLSDYHQNSSKGSFVSAAISLFVKTTTNASKIFWGHDLILHSLEGFIQAMDPITGYPYLYRQIETWPSTKDYLLAKSTQWSALSFLRERALGALNPAKVRKQINRRYEEYSNQTNGVRYSDFFVGSGIHRYTAGDLVKLHSHYFSVINLYSLFFEENSDDIIALGKAVTALSAPHKEYANWALQRIKDGALKNASLREEHFIQIWDECVRKIHHKDFSKSLGQELKGLLHPLTLERFILHQDAKGDTLLLHAVKTKNSKEIVNQLLDLGSDINHKNKSGDTALHFACKNEDEELVGVLLERSAHVDIQNCYGVVPLAHTFNKTIIENLIKHHANFIIPDVKGYPPLWSKTNATFAEKLENVMFSICERIDNALQLKANYSNSPQVLPTSPLTDGIAPFWNKCFKSIKDHIKLDSLTFPENLDKEALYYSGDKHGYSLLHYAVYYNNLDALAFIFDKMLEEELTLHLKDNSGNTPLHVAVRYVEDGNLLEIIKKLLPYTNINDQNNDGKTLLHLVPDGSLEIFEFLIQKHANIFLRDKSNASVVWRVTNRAFALRLEHVFFTYLNYANSLLNPLELSNNIDPTESNWVLIERAEGNVEPAESIEKSVEKVEEVTIKPTFEKTAFESLIKQIKRGKDINLDGYLEDIKPSLVSYKSEEGNTLLHYAAKCKNQNAVKTLLHIYKADPNLLNAKGKTALHYAGKNGDFSICQLLLAYDASVNLQDKQGRTVLHFVNYRRREIFEFLIGKGANPAIYDNDRYFPTWVETNREYAWRTVHILVVAYHQLLTRIYEKQRLNTLANFKAIETDKSSSMENNPSAFFLGERKRKDKEKVDEASEIVEIPSSSSNFQPN